MTKCLPILAAAGVLAVVAPAAGAKPTLAGLYSGAAVHPNPILPGAEPSAEPYTTDFSVTVVKQGGRHRLASVHASARTACAEESMIQDIELFKTWGTARRKGPRLTGGSFTLEKKGMTIHGSIAAGRLTGSISATSSQGCTISGVTLDAPKRRTDW
jgi:hypothetical protein